MTTSKFYNQTLPRNKLINCIIIGTGKIGIDLYIKCLKMGKCTIQLFLGGCCSTLMSSLAVVSSFCIRFEV